MVVGEGISSFITGGGIVAEGDAIYVDAEFDGVGALDDAEVVFAFPAGFNADVGVTEAIAEAGEAELGLELRDARGGILAELGEDGLARRSELVGGKGILETELVDHRGRGRPGMAD